MADIRTEAVRHREYRETQPTTAPGLIGLDIADMDYPSPQLALAAVHERANRPDLRYLLARDGLRDRIQQWYADRHDWTIDRDTTLLLPFGVKAALRMALESCADLTRPVLVCTPVYSGILKVTRAAGADVRHVPLTVDDGLAYALDPDRIAAEIDASGARTLILCSPHNPVGRVWTSAELLGVARATARAGVLVISDEVHSDLVHPGHRHRPWGAIALDRNWIVLHSAGKTFNVSGLQSSFAVPGTAQHRTALLAALGSWGFYEGDLFGDPVAEAVLTPAGAGWLEHRVQLLAALTAVARQALPAPLRTSRPEAGFLLWIDGRSLLPVGQASDLAARIKASTGVRLLDGTRFAAEPGFLRLNAATDPALLDAALARIAAFAAAAPRRTT